MRYHDNDAHPRPGGLPREDATAISHLSPRGQIHFIAGVITHAFDAKQANYMHVQCNATAGGGNWNDDRQFEFPGVQLAHIHTQWHQLSLSRTHSLYQSINNE